ncbi:hypothetical protein LCGC14_2727100, partial [marine sediment metagenome]
MYEFGTTIALDSAGNPHATFFDDQAADLMYASRTGDDWTVSAIDTDGDAGRFADMLLDADDRPHVAYLQRDGDTGGAIKYALFENNLTSDPDDFNAVVQITTGIDTDAIIKRVLDQGSTVTEADLRASAADLVKATKSFLLEGARVHFFGLADFFPRVKGKFTGPMDSFDPARHTAYNEWVCSHKPFHWFIEFYGIAKEGGFDVIIGNPPYVERRVVRDQYDVLGYSTEPTNNLYAYVSERAEALLFPHGRFGFIVPLSSMSTKKFAPLQKRVMAQ